MQFAPSGPLKEMSISNGLGNLFQKMAEKYDKYSYCLNEKKGL